MMKFAPSVVLVLAVTLLLGPSAGPAAAEEMPALDIHAFGGWVAGYSNNDNQYMDVASKDLEVDNYYFSLNLLARPSEKVSIHAQPTWQANMRGSEVRLDMVYAEWNFAKDVRVRAGKMKNPLGIYTEIYKVGTLRPFYFLPAAMYRNVPESYAGAGLNRVQRMGEWELELDVLGGQMDFDPSVIDLPVAYDPVTWQPLAFASLDAQWEGRDFFGGGALLRLPVKGLELGLSYYNLDVFAGIGGQPMVAAGEERTKAAVGSIEYVTDRVSLRTEGYVARGPADFETGYVEAAYKLDKHVQIAAQFDFLHDSDVAIVKQLRDHQSIGFGLNYWVNPKVVWKLNYYHVTNNYLARPADAVNLALAGRLDKNTDVLVIGAHFSF